MKLYRTYAIGDIGSSAWYRTVDFKFWHICLDNFGGKIGWSRGRCGELEFRFPISRKLRVEISTRGKSYLELVGGPSYLKNIDWIIDEFDSSFNDLATASLRYHMDHSVCATTDNLRAEYQDIIDRLNESPPEVFDPGEEELQDRLHSMDFSEAINNTPPEIDAIFKRHDERMSEYDERINKARHDFVDIMRGLWS